MILVIIANSLVLALYDY